MEDNNKEMNGDCDCESEVQNPDHPTHMWMLIQAQWPNICYKDSMMRTTLSEDAFNTGVIMGTETAVIISNGIGAPVCF